MSFTQVTITHDFNLPDGAGAVGLVEFTPAEPMHNGAQTVAGTKRSVLGSNGALQQTIEATTDPGTTPPGVSYRIVIRLVGEPAQRYYARVPHDRGSTIDLADLLDWNTGPLGGGTTPITLTAQSGVITPDGDAGTLFVYVAAADVQIGPPASGSNGKTITVMVKASGGSRTVSYPAGGPDPVTIPDGEWAVLRFTYYQPDDAWVPS